MPYQVFSCEELGGASLGEGSGALDCQGQLVFSTPALVLSDKVRSMFDKGQTNVTLLFGKVTHVDSFGLGILISLLTHLQNKGGDLVLVDPQPQLVELLARTMLSALFGIRSMRT